MHHCEKVFHKAVHATFSPVYLCVTAHGKIERPPQYMDVRNWISPCMSALSIMRRHISQNPNNGT